MFGKWLWMIYLWSLIDGIYDLKLVMRTGNVWETLGFGCWDKVKCLGNCWEMDIVWMICLLKLCWNQWFWGSTILRTTPILHHHRDDTSTWKVQRKNMSMSISLVFMRLSGWWFGTFFMFPYIGNNHPNWRSYFSEGLKPPPSTRWGWSHGMS